MIKKAIHIVLAIALSTALIACGSGKSAAEKTAGDSAAEQNTAAQTASAAREDTNAGEDDPADENSPAEAAEAEGTDRDASLQNLEIPENPYVRDDGGISIDVFAMDTYMTLLAYGDRAEEAVVAAAEEIHRIDDMLSTGNPESEISKLNAAGQGNVSELVVELIEESQTLYKETDGLFDIAIYPVMQLWGFPTQEYRVPEKAKITAALKLTDASKITIAEIPAAAAAEAAKAGTAAEQTAASAKDSTAAEQAAASAEDNAAQKEGAADSADEEKAQEAPKAQVTFGIKGMEIDLGGIAKGYTSSRVMEIFKEYEIEHGLVSLGGNVQALGSKESGDPWRVAIQNPESELDYLGVLEIEDKCVITSGGYERYFEKDGVRYHHIIDPRTGYPADSGIISATIISKDGTLADGLSTSLFIMGLEKAEEFWRDNSDRFDFILEDKDGRLHVSEGAADLLTTEAEVEVVEK